jgi:hypothetical protein
VLQLAAAPDTNNVTFRHALMQEAVYASIPWAPRRELHREVARALSSDEPSRRPVERAAQHFELAGEPRSAVQTLLGAAQSARMRGNIGRAASLGLAALSIAEKHQELAGTRSTLVLPVLHDLFRAGRWTEVTPLAREAWTRRDADFERDRAAIANMLGLSLFYLGAVQEVADLVNGEVDRLHSNSDTPGAALLTSTAAFIAAFRGETDGAIRVAEDALQLARHSQEPDNLHRARNVLIVAHCRISRNRQAAAAAQAENAEFARNRGLTVAEANSWWNYAHMTASLRDYVRAEKAAEQAGTW